VGMASALRRGTCMRLLLPGHPRFTALTACP
jgi:hypothetical protein